jgi:hypothetical protein
MNQNRTEKFPSEEPPTRRGSWYLLTGLVIGVVAGLIFAWLVYPVSYGYSDPSTLKENYKESYRLIIAQVFAATGDIDRAALRLDLLGDENITYKLGAQAQRALANGQQGDAQALALLASALQLGESGSQSTSETTEVPAENLVPTQTLPALTPLP